MDSFLCGLGVLADITSIIAFGLSLAIFCYSQKMYKASKELRTNIHNALLKNKGYQAGVSMKIDMDKSNDEIHSEVIWRLSQLQQHIKANQTKGEIGPENWLNMVRIDFLLLEYRFYKEQYEFNNSNIQAVKMMKKIESMLIYLQERVVHVD